MKNIINYAIVIEHPEDKLFDEEIEEWIQIGWQPYGSPMFDSQNRLVQAMVKYAANQEDSLL